MIDQGKLGVSPRQDMLHCVFHFHTNHDGIRNRRAAAREMSPSIAIAHPIRYTHSASLGLASVWPLANRGRADWDGSHT